MLFQPVSVVSVIFLIKKKTAPKVEPFKVKDRSKSNRPAPNTESFRPKPENLNF